MNINDLNKDTVYVDERGLNEMVVLDLEHTYDPEWYFQRSANGYRTGHGNFLAVLVRDTFAADYQEVDLLAASKQVEISFSEKAGGAWSRTPESTKVDFIRARMIAGQRDAVRAVISAKRELMHSNIGRRAAMEFDIHTLIPEAKNISQSEETTTTIDIDVLERLIKLSQANTKKD